MSTKQITSCEGCQWWSEMIAEGTLEGGIKALCLREGSPNYSRMVCGGCHHHEPGDPVDLPAPTASP